MKLSQSKLKNQTAQNTRRDGKVQIQRLREEIVISRIKDERADAERKGRSLRELAKATA